MSARPLPATGGAAAEDQLLAQLGLPASASPEDLDNLHDAVSSYLAAAPSGIRGWAHAQAAALDAAYLSLTDPVGLEGSALRSPTRPPAVVPGGPATPPVRRGSVPAEVPVAAAVVVADVADDEVKADEADEADEVADDLEPGADDDAEELAALYASVTPSAHEDMAPSAKQRPTKKQRRDVRRQAAATPAPAADAATASPNIWKRAFLATVAVIVVVGVAFGANTIVSGTGGPSKPSPATAQATPAAPPVDQALVADLMAKYQADPKDTATLLALADEFYAGEEYAVAAEWLDKLLAVEPENIQGLLARGAAYFNLNDNAKAESTWKRVTDLDSQNVEAWYDLGFMAFYQAQPDYDAVQRYWGRVVELDPQSDMGKQVQTHLDALASKSLIPGASPAASAAPSGSAAPVASPAASVLQQTAKDLAFGTKELAAPADTPFTIHFNNLDAGLPHDIVIKDASGAEVFKGELVTGPKAVDYAVPALKAGAYTFTCSIHPNMTGSLTVGS